MSARAPFVPQRPASRAPAQSDQNAETAHDTFRPTGSTSAEYNPDNANSSTVAHNNNQNRLAADSDSSSFTSTINTINKPLNVSSFKKKSHQSSAAAIPGRARKSFEEPAARSHSPRPLSYVQQNLRIAAPRPSSPNSSSFVPISNFRTPTLPHPSRLYSVTSNDDLGANGAHTATSTSAPEQSAGFRFSPAHDPAALMKKSTRSSSRPSLEKIHETAEEDEQYTAFDGNVQDGPPRASPYEVDGQNADENDEQQTLRRSRKRPQLPDEDEDTLDYGGIAKRYKMDADGANDFAPPYSRHATLPTQYAAGIGSDTAQRDFAPPYTPRAEQNAASAHVLHRLLGQELDAYVDAHVDTYEQAKKKWAECSMDEWTAGADEITGKFTKMLDFVKDHMTSKLTLYASLHSTMGAHRTVLSEREKSLSAARESLVREGGAVVGGGAALVTGGDQNDDSRPT